MRDQPRIWLDWVWTNGKRDGQAAIAGATNCTYEPYAARAPNILVNSGARVVDNPLDLADCDVVFVLVSATPDCSRSKTVPSEFSRTRRRATHRSSIVRPSLNDASGHGTRSLFSLRASEFLAAPVVESESWCVGKN